MDSIDLIRQLADSALLERVRAGVSAAKNWDDAIFRAMARRDFDVALADWPDAQAFAVAVAELTGRAETLEHDIRAGLLELLHPPPAELKAAKPFFTRFAPEIDRIRELEMYWKNSEAARQRDKQYGVARIAVTCFAKDVERIREFVRQVNSESKFDAVVPRKMPGRPPKPGSEAAKRREEAFELLFGKPKAATGVVAAPAAPAGGETLSPSDSDIASASKTMGSGPSKS